MVNDHELLARLQQVFEAGELAEISARLLRVPEAWVGIHDESLLDRALSADRGPKLSVGRLALLSLGLDAMPEERLSDTLEEKAASVWNAAAQSDTSPTDLPGVALLAIGLLRAMASEGAPHAASLILHAPAVWRSAVACAWPDLPEASVLLRTLLASHDPEALGVASHALLANLSVEDAAAALQQAWGERVPGEALAQLISIEPEMARALAASIEIGDPTKGRPEQSVEDRSDEHLTRAAVFMARGAAPDAALALEAAWEAARGRTAEIADAMADLAEMESNPVLAIEAERQSVHFGPSPARRARLALALAQAGRPDEALGALPSSGRSPEEHVAAAASSRQIGDTHTVEASLRQAADQFRTMAAPPLAWLERLAAELEHAGLSALALQVLQRITRSRPAEPLGRAHFAQALLEAGEASQGASEAAAALMIRPDFLPARRTLAASLQESGRPDAALKHWIMVAEHDPESLIDLGRCALAAKSLETAEKASSQLLARDPGSTAAQILKGEILSQKGDAEGARACLEEATRANPSSAEAWIALAGAQSKCGDAFAGGATLTHAAQLMPQEPRLYAALAAHLDSQGQTRLALEAIERALQGLPGRAEWLALQGELLVRLGHMERAQTVLREALARRPGDSSARLSLAKLLEDSGQSTEAAELAVGLGDGLPPTAYLAAAKIVIHSAEETPDSAKLETAERYLHEIEGAEGLEVQLALWSGRLHEVAGRHAEAFESFRLAEQQISPEAVEDHRAVVIGLARSALATGQASLALATLEAALDRHPTSAELHIAFSQAALQADLKERALQAARQAAELAPHSVPALTQLARAARQIGDWKTAVDALRDLFGLAPRDPAAGFDLVEAALRAEDLPTARATLAFLLWNQRTNPEVLRRAAQALFAAADAGAARAALRRAASLLPPASPSWRALARTSEEVGDLETAQGAWRKCTEIDPKDVEALAHSAGALWKLGRHAASIGLWQRCVALEPKNSNLQRDLARAYMANGETSRGLNHYGLAIQAAPADVSLAHEAGTAALRFGALDEARDTLRHAARLAPHDPEIATALAQALYRLGRPQESLAAIQAIGRLEDLPPAAYAVHSLSAAAVGEGAAARASLDRVLHRPVRGVDDAAWVSRAAAKLGEWDEAVAAFDRVPVGENSQPSPAVRLARIGAILRSLEARLLLSLADVRRHLPNGSQGDQAASDLATLRGSAHGTTPEIEALNLRLGAAMGNLSDEGIQALEALVEKSADPGAGLSLAAAYLAKSQHARAHEVLDSLTPPGSDGSIPMLRGICLAARGDHEMARKAYEQAASDPAFAPASIRLAAESWLAQARPEQAIAALNAALAVWPDEPLWHSRLASLYQEAENPAAALPHLQQAVELDPTDGPAGLALGRALRADGQISQAREVYARVLDRFPAEGAVWKEAGDLALALGEAEVAAGWLERACTLAPSDANALLSSARAAMALGKGREAADCARSAARLAPEDPLILLGLGEILAGQGKLDRALEAYDRALAHAEHPLPVQLARCRLLSRLGKSAEAVTALEELSGEDPENEQIWGALAEARESAGDDEAAIDAATRATRFAPRNPAHHLALARLSRKTGQLDRALDEVHQAQVLDPTEPAIFLELGAIYEGRRETNEALQAYQRAISLNQRSPEAHFRAGVILKGLKSYTQAARMFRRAVDLDPKDAAAAHQLAAVRALELVHGGNLQSAVHP